MRTENDLRAALATLERHAPDALTVLAAVRTKRAARQVINHRRRTRSLIATATAAAASVAAVTAVSVLSAGTFGRVPSTRPAVGTGNAAAVLRQLAVAAASEPTPALGPVLYTKEALLGPGAGSQHQASIQQEWTSAAADYFVAGPGRASASYTKLDPRSNQVWNWLNPATLPADPAALRRHLLSQPGGKAVDRVSPDEAVFSSAMRIMISEPLRPAVRASMLRLVASIVRRSSPEFVVLGTATDPAGHLDIAIAARASELWGASRLIPATRKTSRTTRTELIVYFFDPATGRLRADEYTNCTGPVSNLAMVSARCAPGYYEQYIDVRAVRSLPKGASSTRSSTLAPYVYPWEPVVK